MPTVSEIMQTMDYGPSVEDSAAVRDWLRANPKHGHFIDGAFTPAGAGFVTSDPATGEVLAQISQGTGDDIAAAVRAARKAQPKWAALSGGERAKYLYAIARTIQKRERFLAVLETMDNGKPIRESRDADIPLVVRHFYHHAGWAAIMADEFPGHRPLGVVGQIIPWNFPLLMLAWKIAPAIAAGNTVVLKPAEYTPLTALAFAGICQDVGLPRGVVNIVTGDGATGAALVGADIDKIAFTGSTEVGRLICEATAATPKRLTLELGGKSPFVVMDDADLDAAVEGVVDSIWFNQGQVCCAGSRILVAESAAARFEQLLRRRLARLRVGPPLDKSTDLGAIVHPVQKDRITNLCRQAVDAGAELVGGAALDGCFVAPGYLREVSPANPVWSEEIFGPIATLTTFRSSDEAVALANNSRYGLAAQVWSETASVATDLAAQIRAGVVWINGANMFDAAAPFGGMRESGFGREGGRVGLMEYLAAPPPAAVKEKTARPPRPAQDGTPRAGGGIDRTVKLYIGGAQKRPDGGASYRATAGDLVPLGNRKDIRNAVEAAKAAGKWSAMAGHGRAQVIYFIAENLSLRRDEFAARHGADAVDRAIARLFLYAGWADKFDGLNVQTRPGHLVNVIPGPFGVMGLVCPNDAPLLSLVSMVGPAIAMGNRVVVVPAQDDPVAGFDLAQVFDTSDLPGGVVNIVSGGKDELAAALAAHEEVAALWFCGAKGAEAARRAATGNLKPVWAFPNIDWTGSTAQGREWLERAVQWKTVWLPYGALPAGSGGAAY
ncbi:MAG: aldehyde dehydrogenase family protein [Paracoccus sp. (in: a-proteobacteria)]|nr:aldehyde dehydrogenase family protein [Paracoccus sp. (in: a-proteobacteria)]